MKSVCLIVAFLASLVASAPSSTQVDCKVYQSFVNFKCQEQQQTHPTIGGWCGRTPACLAGPKSTVPTHELDAFRKWLQTNPPPCSLKVKCAEFDAFVEFKCQKQMKNQPGLVGGWCGRPLTCWSSPEVLVPDNNINDFLQWRDHHNVAL
jgi:hypothetical protein